jgi:hypothetical protein
METAKAQIGLRSHEKIFTTQMRGKVFLSEFVEQRCILKAEKAVYVNEISIALVASVNKFTYWKSRLQICYPDFGSYAFPQCL